MQHETEVLRSTTDLPANNLDALRLLLALIVCLVHTHHLSGKLELAFFSRILDAEMAVQAFFVISGMLIFMSYERSSSIRSYFSKRIRRLYPAYIAVILICSIVLSFVSTLPWREYLSNDIIRYLASNILFLNFLQHDLPGVFDKNAFTAVNGALWTIKIEVMFYLAVPLIYWTCIRFGFGMTLGLAFVGSVMYVITCEALYEQSGRPIFVELARQLPGQMRFFAIGALAYVCRNRLAQTSTVLILAIGLATFTMAKAGIAELVMQPLWVSALGYVLAFRSPHLPAARFGDFSYGIYIIHFPVIQTFVANGWLLYSPYQFVMACLAVTTTFAVISWYWIEKPFLFYNNHYVLENESQPIEQTCSKNS